MKTCLAIALLASLASTAVADDTLYWYELGKDGWTVAGTAALSADIKDRMTADLQLHPELKAAWRCVPDLTTSLAIGWTCAEEPPDGTPKTGALPIIRAFTVERGALVPFTLEDVLRPRGEIRAAVTKLVGDNMAGAKCTLPERGALRVNEWTVFTLSDKYEVCVFWWKDVLPLLRTGTTFAKLASLMATRPDTRSYPKDPHATPDARKPPPTAKPEAPAPSTTSGGRFAQATKDSVIDHATGLEWSAHDNGADLDADAADAFAKAYRGGGHSDWRLPTAEELARLVLPELAHRETGDCTTGKNQYVITPLVHLSCGLVWTSTQTSAGTTAMGFISGTPRTSKRSETKNYRVLVVRKAS